MNGETRTHQNFGRSLDGDGSDLKDRLRVPEKKLVKLLIFVTNDRRDHLPWRCCPTKLNPFMPELMIIVMGVFPSLFLFRLYWRLTQEERLCGIPLRKTSFVCFRTMTKITKQTNYGETKEHRLKYSSDKFCWNKIIIVEIKLVTS